MWQNAIDRVLLDFLRTDTTRALSLTGTQLASVAVVVVVGTWLWRRRRAERVAAKSTALVEAAHGGTRR